MPILESCPPKIYNKPYSNYRSLAFIIEGSCKVINAKDNYLVHELRFGEHFGASDLL